MPTHLLHRPHHDGSARFVETAAPALGDLVTVFVRTPAAAGVRGVHVRSTPDGEPRFTEAVLDRECPEETWWRAAVRVRNPVTRYRFLLDTRNGPRWLTALGVVAHDVPDATDFRLVAHAPPPAWAGDAVVYQIFPDRFARSAAAAQRVPPDWAVPCDWDTPVVGCGPSTPYQFYGGDLDGIAEHLDHVVELGATTVYLTPIFPAGSNHRYDGAAFDRVDPLLGGDEALVRLAQAAHARGLRLLGDLTTNHCGDRHPWFRAAADPHAPERDLFYFDGPTDGYESWLGVPSLPKLNWGSAELRRRFVDGPDAVVQRWLRPPYELDGWRVDVANMTGRRGAQDDTLAVARALRCATVRARPDALLVAEHAHDGTGDLDQDGWHGSMNYAGFSRPVWSWLGVEDAPGWGVPGPFAGHGGRTTVDTMRGFAAAQSWRALTHSWTMLGSHDTPRIRTVVGPDRLEVAVGLLCTLPGVPMVFAGDELGLEGGNGEDARRPMPWHRPGSWHRPTLQAFQALIALRHRLPALRHGGLRWAHVESDALVFLRETPDQRVLVLARRAARRDLGDSVRLAGVGARSTENVYGGAAALVDDDGQLCLPDAGPTIQVWLLNS